MTRDLDRAVRLVSEAHDILERLNQTPAAEDEDKLYSYRQVCQERDQWRRRAEAAAEAVAFERRARPALVTIAGAAMADATCEFLMAVASHALRDPEPEPLKPILKHAFKRGVP